MEIMATFLELQTDVAALVIDLPPAVSAAIPTLINQAIKSMQRTYNWRAMEATTTLVTTALSRTPTPNTIANFKEYRDKGPYLLKNLTRAKRFIPVLDTDVDLAVFSDINVPKAPEYLINSVNQAGVWSFSIAPYPDQISDWPDGNYRIIIPSYNYTPDLVNAGDTNWFTLYAPDYIAYKAAAEGFARDWDYDGMALWLKRADEKLREVKKADKTNRLSGVNELVPMWRGANQPNVRR
jgi:hypothetical protein